MNYLVKTKIFFSIIIFFVLSAGCSKQSGNVSIYEKGISVKIDTISQIDMIEYLTLNATSLFQRKEIVRSTFQGSITKVYKRIGDKINSGDELFLIQTKEFAGNNKIDINIEGNKFSGSIALKSHTSGILTELNHNIGDFVSEGEQIGIISDPQSLIIQLSVPFQFSNKIIVGSGCIIDIPNGSKLNGRIVNIVPVVNPTSQTQMFLIKPEKSVNLPENLNLTVKFPIKKITNAFVVPKSALMTDETQSHFWIMKLATDTSAIKLNVEKGIENEKYVQVIGENIKKGDRIISEGAYELPENAKIEILK